MIDQLGAFFRVVIGEEAADFIRRWLFAGQVERDPAEERRRRWPAGSGAL